MKKTIQIILGFIILFGINISHAQSSLPNTGAYYSSSQKIDVTLPEYVGKLAGNYKDDIKYRKGGLLEVDRYRDEYLVIPSNGLVIPIVHIRKDLYDYTLLSSHEPIDINKYLITGALSYPGITENSYGETGNQVIFGHSSYFTNDSGRYKTHFQKIIGLPIGTEIWIYKQNEKGVFERFKYKTEQSFATPPTSLEVLNSGKKKELTLFTCIPIGRTSDRWIVKAVFIENFQYEVDNQTLTSVSYKYKKAINNLMRKIALKSKQQKQDYILTLFPKLEKAKLKTTNKKLVDIIIELQRALEKEYHK